MSAPETAPQLDTVSAISAAYALLQRIAERTDADEQDHETPPDDEAAERTPALIGSRPTFAGEKYLT